MVDCPSLTSFPVTTPTTPPPPSEGALQAVVLSVAGMTISEVSDRCQSHADSLSSLYLGYNLWVRHLWRITCWNLNKTLRLAQSADTVPVSGQSGRSGMLLMMKLIITQNLMITEKENADICKSLNLSEAKNTLKLQSGDG